MVSAAVKGITFPCTSDLIPNSAIEAMDNKVMMSTAQIA